MSSSPISGTYSISNWIPSTYTISSPSTSNEEFDPQASIENMAKAILTMSSPGIDPHASEIEALVKTLKAYDKALELIDEDESLSQDPAKQAEFLQQIKLLQSSTHSMFAPQFILNKAIIQGKSDDCIKLLLKAGIDPNKSINTSEAPFFLIKHASLFNPSAPLIENPLNLALYLKRLSITAPFETPFTLAMSLNRLSLMALFFQFAKEPKIAAALAIKNLNRNEIEDSSDIRFVEKIPLFPGISCYTKWSTGRDRMITHFLRPLILPPVSISELINPLEAFILKESREDSGFQIRIKKDEPEFGSLPSNGVYLRYSTGNIELYTDSPLSLSKHSVSTTLLHETCHKIIDKLKWGKAYEITSAAMKDLQELRRDKWKHCHKAVKRHSIGLTDSDVYSDMYKSTQQIPEECLVRVPQILFDIANEDPTRSLEDIEAIVNRDIPNIYKFYKEKFLPAVKNYNNPPSRGNRSSCSAIVYNFVQRLYGFLTRPCLFGGGEMHSERLIGIN